jgi:hypothetical protein
MLASLSDSKACANEPIPLQESAELLKVFFTGLYSNDPYALFTGENVVGLAKLAFKYNCNELLSASVFTAQRWAKKSKLSGGLTPTIPDLLLLSQETHNTSIRDFIFGKGIHSFCAVPATRPRRCVVHVGQPLPCPYSSKTCTGPAYLDAKERATMAKLNPSTLVEIIEHLVISLLDKYTARVAARPY